MIHPNQSSTYKIVILILVKKKMLEKTFWIKSS